MRNIKEKENDLLVVLGPTATGKTKLAVKLGNYFDGEIISADSRQVYKKLDIGTGKDLNEYTYQGTHISYHLIDIIDPWTEYNVAKFQQDFIKSFKKIRGKNKLPILCGGTGLYIKAVLMNYKLPNVYPNKILRAKLENWSLKKLVLYLEKISPGISNDMPIDTKRRVIRNIEIMLSKTNNKNTNNKASIVFNNPLIIGIEFTRSTIRKRITNRLKNRFENGMIQEVEKLINDGVSYSKLDSLGLEYRYISRYLSGKINKNEMQSQLNTAIHKFAKKQMTFYRNMEKHGIKINWIKEGNYKDTIELIKKEISN